MDSEQEVKLLACLVHLLSYNKDAHFKRMDIDFSEDGCLAFSEKVEDSLSRITGIKLPEILATF